jgi:hypothetical protein
MQQNFHESMCKITIVINTGEKISLTMKINFI